MDIRKTLPILPDLSELTMPPDFVVPGRSVFVEAEQQRVPVEEPRLLQLSPGWLDEQAVAYGTFYERAVAHDQEGAFIAARKVTSEVMVVECFRTHFGLSGLPSC